MIIFLAFALFLVFVALSPFVLGYHILEVGLQNLGLSPESATLILILVILGSLFSIPLGKRISLNVGGAVIPLLLCVYLLSRVPFKETLIAVVLMTVCSRMLSRYIPGKGVVMPALFPAIFAVGIAFFLAREFLAQVSFISGVLGVLIGADLIRLPFIDQNEKGKLSIGGAGVFDGIFLIGIISALISGLSSAKM